MGFKKDKYQLPPGQQKPPAGPAMDLATQLLVELVEARQHLELVAEQLYHDFPTMLAHTALPEAVKRLETARRAHVLYLESQQPQEVKLIRRRQRP